jgi:hypothetical protein
VSGREAQAAIKGAALSIVLCLPLGGCTYDYLQRTDRVGYSAGNAVKANLESETINPSKRSMYQTSGLGKDGSVILPAASGSSTAAATPASASATAAPGIGQP